MQKKLRNLLYAVTATGLLGISGCGKAYKEPEILRHSESVMTEKCDKTEYSLEDFKRVLGDRVIPEREGELERMWKTEKEEDRFLKELFYEIYSGKSFEELRSANEWGKVIEWKKDYKLFNPDSLSRIELNEIKKIIQWKIEKSNGKYNEPDKKILFVLFKINDGIRKKSSEISW